MENVDLTVLKPEDATLLRAVPVTSVLRGSLFNKKSNHFVPAEHGGPHPNLRHSVQVVGNAAFSVSYCPDVSGMWGKASPPEAVSCATTCTTTYWCLVGAYVIVGILMQVGNVNWARWVRTGAGDQPKVHVE